MIVPPPHLFILKYPFAGCFAGEFFPYFSDDFTVHFTPLVCIFLAISFITLSLNCILRSSSFNFHRLIFGMLCHFLLFVHFTLQSNITSRCWAETLSPFTTLQFFTSPRCSVYTRGNLFDFPSAHFVSDVLLWHLLKETICYGQINS